MPEIRTAVELVGDNDGMVLTYCPCCRTVYYGRVQCNGTDCDQRLSVALPDSAKQSEGN